MRYEDTANEKLVSASNEVPNYSSNSHGPSADKPDERSVNHKKSFWGDASTRQRIIFVVIIYGHTVVFMCVAIPYPFMANYILAKGGGKEDAVVVVELVMLTMALSSAFFGRYQMVIGTTKLFWFGLLCFGASQAVFGILQFAPNATTLVVAGCIIKVIQGCGQGAYLVAALTVLCQEFPDNAVIAFGIAESFASIGYTCGPFLGSVLFSVSHGLLLPFLMSIILLIPLFPAGFYLLKDYDTNAGSSNTRDIDFIKKPASVLILGVALTVYGCFGMIDVLSSVYLKMRGFSVVEVGWALVTVAGTYGLASIPASFICEFGNKPRRVILLVGFLGLSIISFAFGQTQSKPGAYFTMAGFGILCAFGVIAAFGELLYLAADNRPELETSFALHSTLSGVWNFIYGIGVFVYPLIGASLLRVTTYEFGLFSVYILGLFVSVVMAGILAIWQRCARVSVQALE